MTDLAVLKADSKSWLRAGFFHGCTHELSGHRITLAAGAFFVGYGALGADLALWVRVVCIGLGTLLLITGAITFTSRPDTATFDLSTGELTILHRTSRPSKEERHPLSEIRGVRLTTVVGDTRIASFNLNLLRHPTDADKGRDYWLIVGQGFGDKSDWEAKAEMLATFLGVPLQEETTRY